MYLSLYSGLIAWSIHILIRAWKAFLFSSLFIRRNPTLSLRVIESYSMPFDHSAANTDISFVDPAVMKMFPISPSFSKLWAYGMKNPYVLKSYKLPISFCAEMLFFFHDNLTNLAN